MNVEDIREFALSLEDVKEGFPFGPNTLVFKTSNKLFLLLSLDNDPLSFNVKCDPEKAIELRGQYESVLSGYHMNKKHWNTIIVDGSLNTKLLKEFISDSYKLVKPKQSKKSKQG